MRRRRFFSWTPPFLKLGYLGRRLALWWRNFSQLNHSRLLSSSSCPGGWGTPQKLPPPPCPESALYQGRSPPAGAAHWLSTPPPPPTTVWGARGRPFPHRRPRRRVDRVGDWFVTVDLKDAYCHIQVVRRHRKFLSFAFERKAYQHTVIPFGLALAPRPFKKCMDAALAPLRLQRIRVLNFLDDWLILAHSSELVSYHRDIVLHHIRALGLGTNTKKSVLTPSRQTVFLGVHLDYVQMQARLAPARISSFNACLACFKLGHHVSVSTSPLSIRVY